MIKKLAVLALWAGIFVSGSSQATLIDRGGGLIYDDVLNITWLQDANYAKTSGYDSDGLMNWVDAMTWATNLSYGGYNDWRLPTLHPSDKIGSANGELSHLLLVDLGNKPFESVLSQTGDTAKEIANFALFANVQPYIYWSGLMYENTGSAWAYCTLYG
jgi:hypothetical protein